MVLCVGAVTGICVPILYPAPPSLSALLLTAKGLEWLQPSCISSLQGEKPLARAMPQGQALCPTSSSLAQLASGGITAHYLILAAPGGVQSVSYQGLMLSQVLVQLPSP